MDADIREAFNNLATLVESTTASVRMELLQEIGEIRSEVGELRSEMRTGFDRLEAATARNTKVLAGGSRAVAALMAWTEKRDALDRKRDREIRDLRARVLKLERGSRRRAG